MTSHGVRGCEGTHERRNREKNLVRKWRVRNWAQHYQITPPLRSGFSTVFEGLHSGAPLATFNREKNLVKSPGRATRGFCGLRLGATTNREKILANQNSGLLWVGSEVIRKRYSYALGLCILRASSGSGRGMECGQCVASSIARVFPVASCRFHDVKRGA